MAFHDLLLVPIITAITIFVLGAFALCDVALFREATTQPPRRQPTTPWIEVIWTVVPILDLGAIVFPSFSLLYKADSHPRDRV